MLFRPLEERDWPTIDWLASNDVQEGDHSAFGSQWGQIRREFKGESVQAVLELDHQVVAYVSLERETADDDWRAFIVLDWSRQNKLLQEAAYAALEALIREQRAPLVWMRELADDFTLIKVLESKGFEVERRYTHGGLDMVNLRKSYQA